MRLDSACCVVILLLFFIAAGPSRAGGIYKWVDEEGVVHYGEQPPPEGARELRIRSGGETESSAESPTAAPADLKTQRDKMIQALQQERLARQEEKQKQRKEQRQHKMQCARAKDTLRQYKSAGSLYRLDADGQRHVLPDAARQQEIRRLQAEIKKRCK